VGPRVEKLLSKLTAPRHEGAHARVVDLLWHLPVGLIDRTVTPRIAEARIGEIATLEVTVAEHRASGGRRGRRRAPYRVLVEDDAGSALDLVYFNADPSYLKRLLPEGSRKLISGKLESYDGSLQIPHPDHVTAIDTEGNASLPVHEPVYPLTAGLTNTTLRKAIHNAIAQLPSLPEWIDAPFLAEKDWPGFAEAIARLHAPDTEAEFLPSGSRRPPPPGRR
jgi:ATP-dependent DNA helicase RecG